MPAAPREPRAPRKTAAKAPVPHHVRRRQSEDAVLESAERLFVKNGFHGTTVDDIAKAAGLTKGAVYFHFRDKRDVLLALLKRAEDRVVFPILNRLRNTETPATDRVVDYVHSWARIALEQRDTMFLPILMSFEFLGSGDPIEREVTGLYDRIYQGLAELIQQGRARGELKDDCPVEAHVAVLVAITDGMLLEWLRRSHRFNGEDVTRALRHFVLGGLLARPPAAATAAPADSAPAAPAPIKANGRSSRKLAVG